MNVLYIDDQKENLNVFRIAFRKRYNVFVTQSTTEGWAILADNDIDVVIADHRMPEMTGIEFLVKAKEEFPEIRTIVISEYINDQIIRNAMKAYSFDGCMGKPWDGEELQQMIEK